MADHKAMQQKLCHLISMASQVTPGAESHGIFWFAMFADDGEPAGPMIDVPTLYRGIASHPDLLAALVELSETPEGEG